MTQQIYDHSQLLRRIDEKFGNIYNFCVVAGLHPVSFLENIGDSDLTADEIKKCVELLDIPHDEIDAYFFKTDESWRKTTGRPKKTITKTTTPPINNRYYTIAEAEKLLGVHRHTLQSRLREGSLKGKLIGRTWRIYKDELFDNSSYLYYFDCEDAVFGEKYLTPAECNQLANGKKEALTEASVVAIAKNLEATLYRCDSDKSHEVCIYDCMD